MGRRWTVGEDTLVDKKWLVITSAVALVPILASRSLPAAVALPLLLTGGVIGIAADVIIRRRHPERN